MNDKGEKILSIANLTKRQILAASIGAIGVGSGISIFSSRNTQPADEDSQYDINIVESRIATAGEYFNLNYNILASSEPDSPEGIYTLEIDQIEENLQKATEAIEAANFELGDSDNLPLVTEAQRYLQFQRIATDAFDVSGESTTKLIRDEHLTPLINQLSEERTTDRIPVSTADLPRNPYELRHHQDEFNSFRESLSFATLGTFLSHTSNEAITIIDNGLKTLLDLSALHQMLRAHILLPQLTSTIIEIDRSLSQSTQLTSTATYEHELYREFMNEIGMINTQISSKGLGPKQIGSSAYTIDEIQQSFNGFVESFETIESSLLKLSTGEHQKSTSLWSLSIESMYKAYDDSPIY